MIWVTVALVCFVVVLHWKQSCGETFGCTPVMANRSLWLSNFRPSVNISSPTTFPSNQSVYCSWRFHVLKGYRIRIHFNSFDLRNSTNCSSSAVELAEEEEGISISLGRYCGGHMLDNVVSNRNIVSVIYTSANGSTLPQPRFHATISMAPAETCSPDHHRHANNNIVLSGTSGRLFSPLFPLSNGVKIQCRWTIKVPEGHRIKLSFQAFHLGLKGLDNCDKADRVEVRDSFDKNNPSYGIFCGNVVPPHINTVGPRMLVTFVSDEERVFQGFEARFDATSEGVCTPDSRIIQLNLTHNSTGRLSSPDYPLQFPSVSACYWRLKAPQGYRIKLRFTTLNIQGNCQENINGTEWIRVDDYFTTDFNSVASYWGRYCGGVQPPVIYSTRNELQVFFTSNYTGTKDDKNAKQLQQSTDIGFYAIYEATTQGYTSRCRTDVTSQKPITLQGHTGSLVSPGYPHSYPIITCTWKIKVPNGYIVEVNIKDFQMDCAGGSRLLVGEDSFCGSDKPSGLLTSESDLKIQMIANEARDDRGFHATFSMTEREVDVASIVPWIVIPIVVVAIGLTVFVSWRRRTRGLDRRSSFKTSIITRNRNLSSVSQT